MEKKLSSFEIINSNSIGLFNKDYMCLNEYESKIYDLFYAYMEYLKRIGIDTNIKMNIVIQLFKNEYKEYFKGA